MSDIGSIGSVYNATNATNESSYNTLVSQEDKIDKLQAEVQLLKEMLSEQNDEDLEQYLSDREKNLLTKMNTMSNKITEQSAFVKDILNKPVMDIITNWSATHQDILKDTADLFTKSNVMDNIQKNDKWWVPISEFLREFIKILTDGERMFYVGLTIVFIGIIFVFVNVTD
jgi:hypothetical protein